MKWDDFHAMMLHTDVHTLHRMCGCLSLLRVSEQRCLVDEQRIGDKTYWVATVSTGNGTGQRQLYWEPLVSNWITPRQVDPAGAFQARYAIEKKYGILAVFNYHDRMEHLHDLLMNYSSLTVTRARMLLSTELDSRGRPEAEWVGLVTVDFLAPENILEWEKACENLVRDEEDAA